MFSCLFGSCFKKSKSMVLTVDELFSPSVPAMTYINKLKRYKTINKDLLKRMLYRSPIARITIEEILVHDFVTQKNTISSSESI